jgi:serine/threonine protein kinase
MIGQTISHYKIVEKLGEGGMGVVYKAQDLKLDRFVAIKVLAPHLSRDKEATARFIHEAKAASALDHSNIGTIHDIDETSEGQTFIVMAYYEGETLHDRMKRGDVTIEETLGYVSQVAAGLAKAHEKGIVHRDIKPSNIIITRDGQAKIMDFGLAKLAGGTKLTRTGSSLGTVAYMSPEQAQGREVDERSDIFSLGTVLYELIAGRLPFKGEHEAAVLYEIVHEEPEPLSSCRSDIPEELGRIAAKALQKDVSARYQKALDMKSDIDELARIHAGTASGAPMSPRVRRAGSRPKLWISLAVIALAIVAGAIALMRLRPAKESSTAKDLSMAIIDFRDLVHPDDPASAAGLTNLVQVGLMESSPIRPISPERLRDIRRRLFGSGRGSIEDDRVLEVARKAGATLFLYAEIAGTAAEQYVTWRLVETKNGSSLAMRTVEAKTLMELANGIVQGALPLLAKEAGSERQQSLSSIAAFASSSEEAYKHYTNGMLALEHPGNESNAIAELNKAVQLDSAFALAYYQLAKTHFDLGSGHSAKFLPKTYTENAWAHRDHMGLKDRMTLEAFREQISHDAPGSLETYKEIHSRWPDDLTALKTLTQYSFFYWYFEDVLTFGKEGLELYPDEGIFADFYAASLSNLGRRQEALEASLDAARKHPKDIARLDELCMRYLEIGMPDSAEAISRRVLQAEPNNVEFLTITAYCDYARGDVNQSIELLEQLMKRSDVSDDWRIGKYWVGFGPGLIMLPVEIGRVAKAFQLLEAANECAADTNYYRVRGLLLLAERRTEDAIRLTRRTLKQDLERDSGVYSGFWERYCLIEALSAADSVKEARSVLAALNKSYDNYTRPVKFFVLLSSSIISLAEGDGEGALEPMRELEKFATLAQNTNAIQYRETLARACWKSGRLKEAADAYKDLLNVFGGHAISRYELGQVYEQMKRPADARREYSKFLEMCSQADKGWPPVEDARKRLAAL